MPTPQNNERTVERIPVAPVERRANQIKVYGSTAALTFDATLTAKDQCPTVTVESACARSDGSGSYDWDNKIAFQFSKGELPMVAAVLLGYLPHCEFRFHGPARNKSCALSLDPSQTRYVLTMAGDGKVQRRVPIGPEDAFYVAGLFIGQLRKISPWLSAEDINLLLRQIIQPLKGRKSTPGAGTPAP